MIELGLPHSLTVCGIEREIYTDFRDVLNIIIACADPELDERMKAYIVLNNLYVDDFRKFEDIEEAQRKAVWFLDCGETDESNENKPRLMDWEQDYSVIIPPINRIAGKEVRSLDYLHWWTFIGYYREIGDCWFAQIVDLRKKLQKGEKLDKSDKELLRNNRAQIVLKERLTESEEETINELFGVD